jgi:SHS2 domain-containing protein
MPRLFINAALGMLSLVTDLKNLGEKKKARISVRSDSWESLLVDWLNEILYRFTVRKTGFSKFEINKLLPFRIEAVGYGEEMDLNRHEVFREIKSVTYCDLKIKKLKGGYTVKIIFDI